MAEAPKRAIKFSLNETYKGKLKTDDGSLPALRAAVAGSMAGMTECSVNTPFEVKLLLVFVLQHLPTYSGPEIGKRTLMLGA